MLRLKRAEFECDGGSVTLTRLHASDAILCSVSNHASMFIPADMPVETRLQRCKDMLQATQLTPWDTNLATSLLHVVDSMLFPCTNVDNNR